MWSFGGTPPSCDSNLSRFLENFSAIQCHMWLHIFYKNSNCNCSNKDNKFTQQYSIYSPSSCSIFSSILNIRYFYILYKNLSDYPTTNFITQHFKFRMISLNAINYHNHVGKMFYRRKKIYMSEHDKY